MVFHCCLSDSKSPQVSRTLLSILAVLLLLLLFVSFSHKRLVMVSHLNLSDSEFSQVSRTPLSILADLNNVVLWMVSTCSLISNFSNPCTSSLVTEQIALIPLL